MANQYRIQIQTGPCGISEIAAKLRDEQLTDVQECTECVTFKLGAFDQTEAVMFSQDLIRDIFGKGTGLASGIKAFRTL